MAGSAAVAAQAPTQEWIARASSLINAARPSGIDVSNTRVNQSPHADDTELRKVEADLGLGPGALLPALMPRTVIRGDVAKDGQPVGSTRVQFLGEVPFTLDLWMPFDFTNSLPLDATERSQVQRQLDSLASAALDVSRGPGRWSQYLPSGVRQFALLRDNVPDVAKYSDSQLLEAVASWVEGTVLVSWSALEQPTKVGRFLNDWGNALGSDDVQAPQTVVASFRKELMDDLRRTDPSHLKADTEFLKDVVFGAFYKISNGDAKVLRVEGLPASEHLYVVQFGMNGVLLLQWSGEQLRIADVLALGR